VSTAHAIGCISHGFNDAYIGGAVLLTDIFFTKNIRIFYFLSSVAFLSLCMLHISTASAATLILAWDKNLEDDVIGYRLHYGTISKNYQHTVDVKK
jgi:hypothetical protein